eukprot:TRINITY_DN60865_c0_g1_i1.p1 TRINITY_DN60865_c0_g1~~TRINITY_DN60865_c0_g1_i1.p1  ORF type:complete len:181 (-),score=39.03 TRINITY_DN60865_c0_g1_i1:157-699(-)
MQIMNMSELLDVFFFQAEDGIRDAQESRGLGDVYKRQGGGMGRSYAEPWPPLDPMPSSASAHSTDQILREAAARGDDRGVAVALRHGADLNSRDLEAGMSALHYAAWHGSHTVLKRLLSHGSLVNLKSRSGLTALQLAAWCGQHASVRTLIQAGATMAVPDIEGRTALHAAVQNLSLIHI